MMLDEPFAGVDPIAVHDIQSIVADLRKRRIGVLISDHNVEQTLDIVDRAYIMFDGQVKVSGTVRELVFDDTVAKIYLGPTLTARLRARFSTGVRRRSLRHEARAQSEHAAPPGAQDQSTPVSGDGSACTCRCSISSSTSSRSSSTIRSSKWWNPRRRKRRKGRSRGANRRHRKRKATERRDRLGRHLARWLQCRRTSRRARRKGVLRAGHRRYA